MSEPENNVCSLITNAVSGVPAPVRASFVKAFSDLMGGAIAIPAAKLKQYAQAIEDTTAARSMIANALAKTTIEEACNDPELLKAAEEIYLPNTLRKVKNRLNVAQSAAENLATAASGTNEASAAAPDDDWMNRFIRFAEDASSERLQKMFGRILAGEVVKPGAFGMASLRVLSELDQTIADDFTQAWAKSVGDAVDYSPYWQRGEGFSRWQRLIEAGLMAPASTSQFLPPFESSRCPPELVPYKDLALWGPINVDGFSLLVFFEERSSSKWNHIDFTRVGKELGSILPKPDYEDNIRQAANNLPRSGLKKIDFLRKGKPTEVIWQSIS